jgi:hypothetical protein
LFSFILVFLSSLRLEMYRAHYGFVYKFGVLFLEHFNYVFSTQLVSDKEKRVFSLLSDIYLDLEDESLVLIFLALWIVLEV